MSARISPWWQSGTIREARYLKRSFRAFPKESSHIWEDFIAGHLELGYWNEYLTEDKVVFLFQLEDGIKRYEVYNFENDEVLALCEKLCQCKMESLEKMLCENHYYKKILADRICC